MKNEGITVKQIAFLIMMFIFGSTAMIGFRTDVAQDTWISVLIAVAFSLPMIFVFVRIIKLYPGKNLFDIMQDIFKPFVGKILIILMILQSFIIASDVVCIFNNFIKMTSLINTPRFVISVTFIILSSYLAMSRLDGFGKGSITVFYIIIATLVVTLLMSIGKNLDLDNLFPIANHSVKDIAGGAWSILAFPIGEIVLFIGLADVIKKDENASLYKAFYYAIFIGMGILLVVFLRNLLLLGTNLMDDSYFPSFRAARVIGISNTLERIEGLITYNFMMAGICKLTICMIVAAKGTTKLFGLKNNYKKLIPPISLMILSFCIIGNDNIIEIMDFLNIYKYYSIPFQIIIPMIVWIGAEIKTRNNRTKENNIEIAPEP